MLSPFSNEISDLDVFGSEKGHKNFCDLFHQVPLILINHIYPNPNTLYFTSQSPATPFPFPFHSIPFQSDLPILGHHHFHQIL